MSDKGRAQRSQERDGGSSRSQSQHPYSSRHDRSQPVDIDAAGITKQYCELLADRRLNELIASRSRSSTPSYSSRTPETFHQVIDPIHCTLHNIPKIPVPPSRSDTSANQFCNMLHMLSITPEKYENPGLLDEALGQIPLQRIYDEADEENSVAIAQATSAAEARGEGERGIRRRIRWGYQDHVIMALLK